MDLGTRLLKSGIELAPVSESVSADMMVPMRWARTIMVNIIVRPALVSEFSPPWPFPRLRFCQSFPLIYQGSFPFSNATVVVADLSSLLAIPHLSLISEGFWI